MAKVNNTKFMILGLLNHEPMSGYDIKQKSDKVLKYFWATGFGQIYPSLKVMTDEGWIMVTKQKGVSGPDKQLYEITDLGRNVLVDWLKEPAIKEHVRYEVLLKLFFSGAAEKSDALLNIEHFKERNEENLKIMKQFSAQLEPVLKDSPDHIYYYLTTSFGEKVYSAYLEWADEASALIEKHIKGGDNE